MYTTAECDVVELSTESPIKPSEICLMDGFIGGIIISNGRVCYNGTTPGAQHFGVPFCKKGTHLLSGDSSPYRECLSNGEWSGTVAQCEPICEFNAVTQYLIETNCIFFSYTCPKHDLYIQ